MALNLIKHKAIVSSLQYHGHFIIALVVNWIYINIVNKCRIFPSFLIREPDVTAGLTSSVHYQNGRKQ